MKRNSFLDFVKGITIFFVILGHVIQRTWLQENPYTNLIFQNIYTFHMPVFMGICGYSSFESIKRADGIENFARTKLIHRVLSLSIPMFSFGVISVLCNGWVSLKGLVNTIFFGSWFLGDLLVNTILICPIVYIAERGRRSAFKRLAYILGLIVAILVYRGIGLLMYLSFMVGYLCNQYNVIQRLFRKRKILLLVSSCVYILCMYLYNILYEPGGVSINIWRYSISHLLVINSVKIALACVSSFLFLYLCHFMYECVHGGGTLTKIIDIGQHTLEIYLLDTVIPSLVYGKWYAHYVVETGSNPVYSNGIVFEIVVILVGAILSLLVLYGLSKGISKISVLNKILFCK